MKIKKIKKIKTANGWTATNYIHSIEGMLFHIKEIDEETLEMLENESHMLQKAFLQISLFQDKTVPYAYMKRHKK